MFYGGRLRRGCAVSRMDGSTGEVNLHKVGLAEQCLNDFSSIIPVCDAKTITNGIILHLKGRFSIQDLYKILEKLYLQSYGRFSEFDKFCCRVTSSGKNRKSRFFTAWPNIVKTLNGKILYRNLIRNSEKITAFQYQFHKMRYLKMNGARYVMGLTRIDFHGVTAVNSSHKEVTWW